MKKKFKIPVGRLFEFFGLLNINPECPVRINRYLAIKNQFNEFKKINYLVKKRGQVNTYFLDNNLKIKCDENHLVRENNIFVNIKNVSHVDTIYGTKKILKIIPDKIKDVYDFSIDYPHEYITNQGIICHNTTLASIIADNTNSDSCYINASNESGIDVVRNKIIPFASSVSLNSIKIIILDECLDENTLVVVLRNGKEKKIKIKDLNDKNDLVKSFNVKSGRIEWMPFYLWDKGEHDVYEIELENGEVIICTEDHKWYVTDENNKINIVSTKELNDHILSY